MAELKVAWMVVRMGSLMVDSKEIMMVELMAALMVAPTVGWKESKMVVWMVAMMVVLMVVLMVESKEIMMVEQMVAQMVALMV
jgi:hypothetical protein